jgi:lipopolysaccharide/colanic/teichoic acid biosynthesis glycosyltransferase
LTTPISINYQTYKRILDLFVATFGLIIFSPLIAGVAIAVAIKLGRPVLFTQRRPGLDGKIFVLYKFRTMTQSDESGELLTDEDRLTQFGKRLRSTSLDELPSLINVIRGDMSIVGPRPLLVNYLSRYSKEQARRHEVRPGITGLAQVNGRNAISWDEKFKLDVEYVERVSLRIDLLILVKTISSVLQREGITAEGHATNFEFEGPETGDGVER